LRPPDDPSPVRLLVLRGHIWTAATLLPLLVKFLPVQWLVRVMTPPARLHPYRKIPVGRIVALVNTRLRKPRNMRRRACLRKGLVLYQVLRLAGQPAVLHFGVYAPSLDTRRLHGHCWVTVNDVILTDPPGSPAAVVMTCDGQDRLVPPDSAGRK
jgi:hypothetical protein